MHRLIVDTNLLTTFLEKLLLMIRNSRPSSGLKKKYKLFHIKKDINLLLGDSLL